ncbi:MAG TPA: rRNA maturation RNase YbeY [Candidatus Paceibacterota bacterium]|nr:rRNA maturation RNase YbeY [Candidatus Paceibacterota bacterium]
MPTLEKELDLAVRRILKKLKKPRTSVDVVLLSARELDRLKDRFGLKKPGKKPDVLSFPEPAGFPHPEKGPSLLGEIYLNRELAPERLRYLLIHGILHLLGYTHEKRGDILRMEKKEKELMKSAR